MNKDRSAQAKTKFSSFSFFYILILIFVPYAIQFAHFGTTESLLMLFYSLIVYGSLKYWNKLIPGRQYVMMTSFFVGLAVATKISSLVFVGIPVLVILFSGERPKRIIINCCIFIFFVAVISLLFSPQSLISWPEFINSMKYESAVGTGSMPVFYTRQFLGSLPIVFQMEKIFPYVLGWPIFIFFLFGFALLSWKKKSNNLLRLAFLVYFIPNAGLFAKWTRFMAPVFPVATLISVIFINKLISNIKNQKTKFQIKNKKVFNVVFNIFIFQIFVLILIPGIAYLSIYQNQDVRFKASEWIYKNIPNGTTILSETANVVDIPLPGKQSQGKDLKIISFDFYELDNSLMLQQELKDYLKESGYIFVPSRRIFMNHSKKNYPVLNEYYQNLFSGQAGFFLVKEFNAYPRICLPLIKSCFIYPDEQAEETWSVFDHPTIRIYKKITKG